MNNRYENEIIIRFYFNLGFSEKSNILYILNCLNGEYSELIIEIIKEEFPQYIKIIENPNKYRILL